MRACWRWLLVGMLLALPVAPAWADGNANFLIGGRGLNHDFWDPVDGQGVFGASVDFGAAEWPVNLEAAFYVSAASETIFESSILSDVDVHAAVIESTFGVNKTWKLKGGTHPFIGGGLAVVTAALDLDAGVFGEDDDHDGSLGAYFHGGVFWRLGPRFNIGVDGRLMGGTKVTLFGSEGDADYVQLGMILGWGWPETP